MPKTIGYNLVKSIQDNMQIDLYNQLYKSNEMIASLNSMQKKQERLMMFSKTVSSLQNKARETKYKERLGYMESQTMIMLVVTGVGVMLIILIAMMMMFNM